jgi:HAE1 family hydrophobic/amphiphilic exporter-1/multidrug efflux pump
MVGAGVSLELIESVRRHFCPDLRQRRPAIFTVGNLVGPVINGQAPLGGSSGTAMDAIERVAAHALPAGYAIEWSGLSFQERRNTGQEPIILGLSFRSPIFLVAQYESWTLPIAVILSLSAALFRATGALILFGQQNSVYAQIAIVLLIGLPSKNDILIVEFAKERHEEGLLIPDAARIGAEQRSRAVMVTAVSSSSGSCRWRYRTARAPERGRH